MFRAPCSFLFVIGSLGAQPYLITTIAGGAPPSTPAAATAISVGDPARVATDAAGNFYFAGLHAIFKVNTEGAITRIAGTGRIGISGDGGPAVAAQVNEPVGIAVDAAGNLYFTEREANQIRRVSPDGIIIRFAGTGQAGYAGDHGPAADALLNGPMGLTVDANGSLFVADTNNHVIRKIAPDGTISTVAGVGYSGYSHDGAAATEAHLNTPEGVAVDANGDLFIADTYNNRIRVVHPDGIIETYVADGYPGYSGDGGAAAQATLFLPTDVAIDSAGNLYIADLGNNRIRRVAGGTINTLAGTSRGSLVVGEAAVAVRLNGPSGIAVDPSGNVYFTQGSFGSGSGLQLGDNLVWKVTPEGVVAIAAGNALNSFSGDFGPAVMAQLDEPRGAALDAAGNLYFADTKNHRIRKISPGGTITTVAGNAVPGFAGDGGPATLALLNEPTDVALDSAGNLFIADTGNDRVRMVFPNGVIGTVAGNGNAAFYGDGSRAIVASLNSPRGVAVGPDDELYIADTGNHRIRRVDGSGILDTVVGRGRGFGGDGGPPANALLSFPSDLAFGPGGAMYIADQGNGRIRRVGSDGLIQTLAGDASPIDAAGISVDASGNVYASDFSGNRVLRIAPGGDVADVAGTGDCCYAGDGGPAASARLNHPWGVAAGPGGDLFIADSGNSAMRYLYQGSADSFVRLVSNGASNLPGPIAPGEIVVIFGSGLGPSQIVLGENSGVVVRFDGVRAPLLYASNTQLSAIVPYAASGGNVQITVEYAGQTATATAAFAQVAPGLFTADASGTGQAKAVNQDGSDNSASRPALPGSVVSFFATGEGQTSPEGVDGKMAGNPAPRPVQTVTAFVDGRPAAVKYAGGIPGVVAGVMQVDVQIPEDTASGSAVPVSISIAGVASQTVTIAVGGN